MDDITLSVDGAPLVVASFFTPNYRDKAERLAASLGRLGIPHALRAVPAVHRSTSAKGSGDIAVAKPRLIAAALQTQAKPVVFVDCDFVFNAPPAGFETLVRDGIDFAIYSWLADPMNDAWVGFVERSETLPNGMPRYWQFSHCIDSHSTNQIICSGGVQFWRNSAASQRLLAAWEDAIKSEAGAADDECLNLAFNLKLDRTGFTYRLLPKEYARYAFWIYARPLIDHPDLPATTQQGAFRLLGDKQFDAARITRNVGKQSAFPRACIIDALKGELLVREAGGLVAVSPVARPLFIG